MSIFCATWPGLEQHTCIPIPDGERTFFSGRWSCGRGNGFWRLAVAVERLWWKSPDATGWRWWESKYFRKCSGQPDAAFDGPGLSRAIWLIRRAPGQPLPMKNNAFDRVILESVLGIQDTPLLLEMLREIYRVLKNGGWMIANEAIWKPGISGEVVQRINQSCLRDFGVRLSSEHPWSVEEWKAAIGSAGLEVVSCRRIAEYSPEMGKLPSPFRGKGLAFPLITALGRIKSFLSPVFIAARRRYAKSLQSHAEDGQYIEARLFIARKP